MKLFLFLTFCLLSGMNLTTLAQGNGSDGDLVVNSTVTINHEKSTLAQNALAGSTSIEIGTGGNFVSGDLLLIIQMQGTNQGQYELLEIGTAAGTTLSFNTALVKSYYAGGLNRAQIVKVSQFSNVTINNGGVLTAPAWNGSTGGLIAFHAKETLHIASGGKIDATGLGFTGGSGGAAGTGGLGGVGGMGGGTLVGGANGLNGGNAAGGSAGGEGGPVALGLLAGGRGGNGGGGGGSGSEGTSGTTGDGPGAGISGAGGSNLSLPPLTMLLGGGGGGGKGGAGSPGAGGGGGGGSGTLLTHFGGDGGSGSTGAKGGRGGDGGIGGGIILIKTNVLSGGGDIVANGVIGGNGIAGEPGNVGGSGGSGGESLLGVVPLNGGGGGGGGKGGEGGAGGNAGGGGGSGIVYMVSNSLTNWTGVISNDIGGSGSAGAGGAAGSGGAGGIKGRGLNILGIGSDGVAGTAGTNGKSSVNGTLAIAGNPVASLVVLPVELISFSAKANKEQNVELHWSTAQEKDASYFSIERSRNGKKFSEIRRVAAAGNSTELRQYAYVDESPLTGLSYYRLVQIDLDGKTTRYRMVNVRTIVDSKVYVFPNPVQNDRVIYVHSNKVYEDACVVKLYNMAGVMVYSKTMVNGIKPSDPFKLPDHLSSGIYQLSISTGTYTGPTKSIIIR